MPLHILWDNDDKTIIRNESEGRWTWDEYHTALTQIATMIKSVNHRVDLINLRRPSSVHPSGSSMPHYQRAMRMMPENAGMNVLVNTSTFARTVVGIFLRLYGKKGGGNIALAASLEEARALIAKDRQRMEHAPVDVPAQIQ